MTLKIKDLARFFIIIILLVSCKKDWLEKKPTVSLTVPSTLEDFQALLDNISIMNTGPSLGEVGADDYYIEPNTIISQDAFTINSYIWATNGWQGTNSIYDWSGQYNGIFISNLTLQGLSKINKTSGNASLFNSLYGSSLFFRGSYFFNIAQTFSKPFDSTTSDIELGIPLRLDPNVNQIVQRSNIQDTYQKVINDLNESMEYLPLTSPFKTRPTLPAAYAMLSRVYLSIEQYDSALVYANKCLKIIDTILNYSQLSTTGQISFPSYEQNPEIIFYSTEYSTSGLRNTRATVDSNLFKSYEDVDARKVVFFRKSGTRNIWSGNYSGNANILFNGLATDEILLIRAECYIRKGFLNEALGDLNHLLSHRCIKNITYTPFVSSDNTIVYNKIISERRKELLFRSLRWLDLRRFNKHQNSKTEIRRIYNNNIIILSPNDNRYAWPIPDDEILYSNIKQNPR